MAISQSTLHVTKALFSKDKNHKQQQQLNAELRSLDQLRTIMDKFLNSYMTHLTTSEQQATKNLFHNLFLSACMGTGGLVIYYLFPSIAKSKKTPASSIMALTRVAGASFCLLTTSFLTLHRVALTYHNLAEATRRAHDARRHTLTYQERLHYLTEDKPTYQNFFQHHFARFYQLIPMATPNTTHHGLMLELNQYELKLKKEEALLQLPKVFTHLSEEHKNNPHFALFHDQQFPELWDIVFSYFAGDILILKTEPEASLDQDENAAPRRHGQRG